MNQSTHSLLRADLRFEGGELDRLEAAPRAAAADDLGLEEADDRLREGIVEGVPHRAHRGLDAGLGQALGVPNGKILRPAVRVRDQPGTLGGLALVDGLLQRVEHEVRRRAAADAPAHDPPRVGVDDEGDVDEALPGGDVGEVADPQPIRRGRVELPPHAVQRARCSRVLDRRLHGLASHRPAQPHGAHQPLHGAAGDRDALAAELAPDLARAVRARSSRRAPARSQSAARRRAGRGRTPGPDRAARRRARDTSTGRSPAAGRSARPRRTRGDRR